MRTTTEVFQDHLTKRLADDLEGDIRSNYATDVIIMTGTGVFHGHDGVRHSARELARYLGKAPFQYDHTSIEGDYAFLEWTSRRKDRDVRDGADSFVIKDGKIILQTIHYSVTENK